MIDHLNTDGFREEAEPLERVALASELRDAAKRCARRVGGPGAGYRLCRGGAERGAWAVAFHATGRLGERYFVDYRATTIDRALEGLRRELDRVLP